MCSTDDARSFWTSESDVSKDSSSQCRQTVRKRRTSICATVAAAAQVFGFFRTTSETGTPTRRLAERAMVASKAAPSVEPVVAREKQ